MFSFFFHSKPSADGTPGGGYLEADLEVVAELRAAAHLAVETLVDEAVELIGAVATVVVAVAQQRLVQALAVAAHEGRLVASPLWIQNTVTVSFETTRAPRIVGILNTQFMKQ